MTNNEPMMAAMADTCRDLIAARRSGILRPRDQRFRHLGKAHLVWMCDEVTAHTGDWSHKKLQRWIRFVQGEMIADGTIGLCAARTMFDTAHSQFDRPDQDLLDHHDPDSLFELDLGGQG